MKFQLSALELRVIGVLIEKEITTPDQYPLSINALTNGCNQKSNREPVMELTERVVQETVDGLIKKYLARSHSGFGSRVSKYQHRFCNSEFGELKLSPQELAIMCELMLRGPQTPGELRGRAERMAKFTDVEHVEKVLDHLMGREPPMVVKLVRQPGKREHRYAHLIGDGTEPLEVYVPTTEAIGERSGSSSKDDRLAALEATVSDLQSQIKELKEMLELLIAER